jgi:hypothetical protein
VILIVSIPRLLSTTGRYRRRTLLVSTTRAGHDTPNALVTGRLAWENGRAGKRANAPRPLATPTSTKEVPGMTRHDLTKPANGTEATVAGSDVKLIEAAARVIVIARERAHSAPYHLAYALHQAGMLTQPGGCSQAPHPGVEFYGPTGGCAECGYRPPAPPRQCCVSRVGQRHAWGCDAIAEATS